MNWFKLFAGDYPTQGGGVVLAHFLIFGTGLIVMARLAFGVVLPEGYGDWFMLLGALAGVSTIGMIGKRATDREYQRAKTAAAPTTTTTETTSVSTETRVQPASSALSAAPEIDPDKDEVVERPAYPSTGE